MSTNDLLCQGDFEQEESEESEAYYARGFEQGGSRGSEGKSKKAYYTRDRVNSGGVFWGQNPRPKFPRWVFLREPTPGVLSLLSPLIGGNSGADLFP